MGIDDASDPIDGGPDVSTGEQATEYEITSDDRTWAILVHASAFSGLVVPFANIIAPLLIWLIKKEESPFVDDNGRNAVNFQISWTIYLIVSALLIIVLIGLLLLPLLGLAWIVLVILAAVRASNDEVYDYPLTIGFVS